MSLGRAAGEGLAWTTAARGFSQLVGVAVTLTLARLLTPEDFGLVAMIAVLTGFLGVVGDMGLAEALVQRPELDERHRSSVFWLNVLLGLALAGALAASAPYVARFYGDQRLVWLVRVLAIDFAIAPLQMVQHAILLRELRFRELALAESIAVVVSGLIALAMALAGYGVWALIAKLLAATVSVIGAFWLLSSWRPRLVLDRAAIRDLWGFSSHLLGFSTIAYWARQVDDLLIGRVLGPAWLGLYGRAYATMNMPVTEIGSVLTRVMFPTFSKLQHDRSETKTLYLRVVAVLGFVTFPVMLGMGVLADRFILVLYGEQWLEATSVLQIYCVVGCSIAIGSTTNWLYKAQGRTDLMFRWGLCAAALTIASIVLGIWLGSIESVALCYGVMHVVILAYPRYAIPGRLIGMSPAEVLRATRGALAAALGMAGLVWALGLVLGPRLSAGLDLLVRTLLGAVSYLVLARVFRVRGYAQALSAVRGRLLDETGERSP
jgi:O-antigen/teichoic acid export membrane protein